MDQFYTKPNIALECISKIKEYIPNFIDYTWIEPSAGKGSFLIPGAIGLDIDPKVDSITKIDFLDWNPPNEKCIVYGNPPFGRQSSLAKKFIRKGCQFADIVAFILPRSFMKPSMNSVFDPYFHCIYSSELPANSFEYENKEKDVPCIFQIWAKKDFIREKEEKIPPSGFKYVKKDWDIAIRRVGINAGKCTLLNPSPQSHYFLKFEEYNPEIIEKINQHVFPSNTVGPRSLSKSEINIVLNSLK